MRTHEELKALALSDPEVRTEYERIEREEMPVLDDILKVRAETGRKHTQVAEHMGSRHP